MAFIRGFGKYLPARVASNEEVAAAVGCTPEWIGAVSGIRERRYAGRESVADMALAAAEDCLKAANAQPAEIGLLIVASGTSERRFPGPAAEVAWRLGMQATPAIDLPVASAGSLFGLALASQLAPVYGNILMVGAEKLSTIVMRPPVDPRVAVLFGDGAGACLIGNQEGLAVIVDSCLYSDGTFSNDLTLDFDKPPAMNGAVVILQASRKIPSAIAGLLCRHAISPAAVGCFLMHQANQNLLVRVAKAVGVAPEKFYSNIERYGNTSSASMLIAAAEWSGRSGFRPDEPVVFAGFGAGFHWGAVLASGVR